jgi:ABC-2 type transport system permease protein
VALFGYGAILMRGVIEEKTSRIIEVIASSIRPMEILIGKILGITSVALLQFAIWVFLFFSVSVAAGPILASITSPTEQMTELVDKETMSDVMRSNPELSGAISAAENTNISNGELPFDIPEIEFSLILYFFLYFILGYFLYASLFAAIGSAVDSETDSQQLMTPVMILIMFAYFFNVQVMQSPDTTLSIAVSLIPFFSPINMITRIAISEVPFWQIAISLSLLVVMIWGILTLSARIYQNGILSYGKKATFKDLLKWVRTSS